ncbi:MAG TPA: four helix bundle protein [Vicinamibacterales bacterium]|nr:four helix bundle protein [Vicinamibacterales bacterium]
MKAVRNYRDLEAWRFALDAALLTYRLTAAFPVDERYGLTAQMRRAAVSAPSNLAEGQARRSPKSVLHFIAIALGSLAELDTQLEIAIRLAYVTVEAAGPLQAAITSSRRLAFGLRRSQRRRMGLAVASPAVLGAILFLVVKSTSL